MPTFKLPKVQMLKDVPLGSLISFNFSLNPQQVAPGQWLGIRGERTDGDPVVILLNSDKDHGMEAVALPRNPVESSVLLPETHVLTHAGADGWTLATQPLRWDLSFAHQAFDRSSAGRLLLRDGGLGLAVFGEKDCAYFNLRTWQLEDPNALSYMVTRNWGIARPGVDGKTEWLFKIPDGS